MTTDALIQEPMFVLAVLLVVLAALFAFQRTRLGERIFRVVPLLVFAYFVPTVLSNLGVIPVASSLYGFIREWLLPASLLLLVLSIDIPAIARLGRPALILFFTATAGIFIGGPIAYLLLGWFIPESLGEQAWKGLAALCGSWIGGGANFIAVGKSVGADDTTLGLIAVVDIAVGSIWMAILLSFAGRQHDMDARIDADRSALDEVQARIERFQLETARTASLADLLLITAAAFGGAAAAQALAGQLPPLGDIISRFTWVVILVTAFGVALSFTPARRLEGAGASRVGSLLLYLLIASIGAGAEFHRVVEAPVLVAIGAVWIAVHGILVLSVRRWLRAPIFFAAVGSQANVGAAASAPVVAAAFHPSLAPVGLLLAVAGYVLGTYLALVSAFLLRGIHEAFFA